MPYNLIKCRAGDRVLMCDHEPLTVRLLKGNLRRRGCEVVDVQDGGEALALLQEVPFDRAVIGTSLPNVDGYRILEWIRTNESTREMWVALIIQGREEVPYLVHRPDAYLERPLLLSKFML